MNEACNISSLQSAHWGARYRPGRSSTTSTATGRTTDRKTWSSARTTLTTCLSIKECGQWMRAAIRIGDHAITATHTTHRRTCTSTGARAGTEPVLMRRGTLDTMSEKHTERCKTCGRRARRGSHMNARYWALLGIAASKIKNKGQSYSSETLHHYYKARFLGCDDFVLPNGKTLVIPRSTADLDTAEFSDYMTQVEADLNERDIFLDEVPS